MIMGDLQWTVKGEDRHLRTTDDPLEKVKECLQEAIRRKGSPNNKTTKILEEGLLLGKEMATVVHRLDTMVMETRGTMIEGATGLDLPHRCMKILALPQGA